VAATAVAKRSFRECFIDVPLLVRSLVNIASALCAGERCGASQGGEDLRFERLLWGFAMSRPLSRALCAEGLR